MSREWRRFFWDHRETVSRVFFAWVVIGWAFVLALAVYYLVR
jgi:hypothetical protein